MKVQPILVWGVLGLLGVAALWVLLSRGGGFVDPCNSDRAAWREAQRVVTSRLRSPATATFPARTAEGVSLYRPGECAFAVFGYVDSQNAFGAMLRTRFSVTLRFDPDRGDWESSELELYSN